MKNQKFVIIILFASFFANAETVLVKGLCVNPVIAVAANAAQYQIYLSGSGIRQKPETQDAEILNPETILVSNPPRSILETIAEDRKITGNIIVDEGLLDMEKPIEDVIAEDNKIIDSHISMEAQPLLLERTIEDVIEENNQIIENPATESRPLDFKTIDRKPAKKETARLLVGMN